jgi:hypothetical protein
MYGLRMLKPKLKLLLAVKSEGESNGFFIENSDDYF